MSALYEKFEDILRQNPSVEEIRDFTNNLTSKEKESFDEYKRIRESAMAQRSTVPEDLKNTLNKLGEDYFDDEKKPINNVRNLRSVFYLRIAAAFLILAAAFFLFDRWNAGPNYDANALVAENYYSKKSDIKRSDENTETLLYKGVIEYESGNYNAAVGHFLKIEKSDPDYMQSIYYRANAYFKNGNTELAIQMYRKFLGTATEMEDYAEWNMMLGHLKLGNLEEVYRVLDRIDLQPDHLFYKKAKDFRKSID